METIDFFHGPVISRGKHSKDWDWHFAVDSIILDTKGKRELL